MNDNRLKIGIVAWSLGENGFGVTKAYLDHLQHYGDPVPLCPMEGILDDIDMVVLPGGKDVYPFRYKKKPGYFNSDPDPFKEYFVDNNLDQYIEKGIPVWGTCLGFQQLVIKYGGNMIQNINIGKHGYSTDSRDELAHPLTFAKNYLDTEEHLLSDGVCSTRFKKGEQKAVWTNSLHHQGVPVKDGLGKNSPLEIIAWSGGYVEAVKHKELPIIGCQFHLEEDYNDLGTYLFTQLVNKAKEIKHGRSNKESKEKVARSLGDLQ